MYYNETLHSFLLKLGMIVNVRVSEQTLRVKCDCMISYIKRHQIESQQIDWLRFIHSGLLN